jgi:hypothetical protein
MGMSCSDCPRLAWHVHDYVMKMTHERHENDVKMLAFLACPVLAMPIKIIFYNFTKKCICHSQPQNQDPGYEFKHSPGTVLLSPCLHKTALPLEIGHNW